MSSNPVVGTLTWIGHAHHPQEVLMDYAEGTRNHKVGRGLFSMPSSGFILVVVLGTVYVIEDVRNMMKWSGRSEWNVG